MNKQIVRVQTCVVLAMLAVAGSARMASAERRPEREIDRINKALDALDVAHKEIKDASKEDFHGHKQAALDQIDRAKKVLEESRDRHVDKAAEKIDDAVEELRLCIKGDREEDHPRIHDAVRTLKEAKDQL